MKVFSKILFRLHNVQKNYRKTWKLTLFKCACHTQNGYKNIHDISCISYNNKITYMSKIIQSAVTKLINNELLVKYQKFGNGSFNITTCHS